MMYGYSVYFCVCLFEGGLRDFEFFFKGFHGGGVCSTSCANSDNYEGVNFPSLCYDVVKEGLLFVHG